MSKNSEKKSYRLKKALAAASSVPTASEAIYGFVAWLNSRNDIVAFGKSVDAAPAAKLASDFLESNELAEPRMGVFPDNINYPAAPVEKTSKIIIE